MTPWILVRDENALIWTGGRTILGRVMEMLRREGCKEHVLVCPEALKAKVEAEVGRISIQAKVLLDEESDIWKSQLGESAEQKASILLVDADVVYDKRLLHWACAWDAGNALVDSQPEFLRQERPKLGDKAYVGLATLDAVNLKAAASDKSSFFDVVEGGLAGEVELVDLDTLPRYALELRRALRPYWVPVADQQDIKNAKKIMVEASGKGHQEWAVLVFNRPVEKFLTYFLCDWRITPNQITVIGNIIAYGTTVCFALGHFWWGILIALVAEVFDGLDGRQARIQIKTSKLGEFEHVLDKIHEITWMGGLAWYFSNGFEDLNFLWLTLGWVAFHFLDNGSYSYFRIKRGMVVDEASKIDAGIRLFASNRNNNIGYLAIGLLVHMAYAYPLVYLYYGILAWSVVTPFLHWIRIPFILAKPEIELGPHAANRGTRIMKA